MHAAVVSDHHCLVLGIRQLRNKNSLKVTFGSCYSVGKKQHQPAILSSFPLKRLLVALAFLLGSTPSQGGSSRFPAAGGGIRPGQGEG